MYVRMNYFRSVLNNQYESMRKSLFKYWGTVNKWKDNYTNNKIFQKFEKLVQNTYVVEFNIINRMYIPNYVVPKMKV